MRKLDVEGLHTWNDTVVSLLSANAGPPSGASLARGVAALVPHDVWWCIFLSRDQTATLYEHHTLWGHEDHYADGPYLFDPIYISFMRKDAPGLYKMRQLARRYPTVASRYFEYDESLCGKIDEIGLTFDLTEDIRAVFSIGRSEQSKFRPSFSNSDCLQLNSLSPVIDQVFATFGDT